MRVFDTDIPDVKIIEPTVYEDERGYFFEAHNSKKFAALLGFNPQFCQTNESQSVRGVIRGLHLQKAPHEQSKLVRVIYGTVLDVAVDCRPHSRSFGKHVAVELSGENHKQLWIPKGFAHGFQVLSKDCVLCYQVDDFFNPTAEMVINAFDVQLGINWHDQDCIQLNERDKKGSSFGDICWERCL